MELLRVVSDIVQGVSAEQHFLHDVCVTVVLDGRVVDDTLAGAEILQQWHSILATEVYELDVLHSVVKEHPCKKHIFPKLCILYISLLKIQKNLRYIFWVVW